MNPENVKINVREELDHAEESMAAADVLFEAELYREAVPKIYYAMFHNVKGLLFSLGLEPKTHDGTNRLFSLHFIKSGKLPVKMSRFFSQMMKYRHEADYQHEFLFTAEDCREWLDKMREFSAAIREYLKKEDVL